MFRMDSIMNKISLFLAQMLIWKKDLMTKQLKRIGKSSEKISIQSKFQIILVICLKFC